MQTLYVFFGMIASGKSTLARAFAETRGLSWYNTDQVRKKLAGVCPTTRCQADWGQGIYNPGLTRKTYATMLEQAMADLARGTSGAVLDGSFLDPEERNLVRQRANQAKTACIFILCVCSPETAAKRLAIRAIDRAAVSDGRLEILNRQRELFVPPQELSSHSLVTIDTDAPVSKLLSRLDKALPPQ